MSIFSKNLVKQEIQVDGLHCPMCEKHISDALKEIKDIKKVDARSKTQIVRIESTREISEAELKEKIESVDKRILHIQRVN